MDLPVLAVTGSRLAASSLSNCGCLAVHRQGALLQGLTSWSGLGHPASSSSQPTSCDAASAGSSGRPREHPSQTTHASLEFQGHNSTQLQQLLRRCCPASHPRSTSSAPTSPCSTTPLSAWRPFPSSTRRPDPHGQPMPFSARSFASATTGAPSTSSTSTSSSNSSSNSSTGSSSSTSSTSAGSSSRATGASVDAKEAAKFAALAAEWWRGDGPFAPLHALNPARVRFVRHSLAAAMDLDAGAPQPLAGLRVLDVGCGGGILSESLARLGAQVTGIDVTRENVEAARLHAAADPAVAERVRYEVISVEDLAAAAGGTTGLYDAVLASEVLEHVARPHAFVGVLASLLAPRPGASVIISTLNRTPAAWAVAIAGAEYVTGVVPVGTHSWNKFITPEELAIMGDAAGLQVWHAAGMAPLGPALSWTLTSDLGVNYIASLRRRDELQQQQQQGQGQQGEQQGQQGQGQQQQQQQQGQGQQGEAAVQGQGQEARGAAAVVAGGASGMEAPGMGLP